MAENKELVPEKYDVNAKWDACLDLSVRRFVYSSLAGAFGGLLFFSLSPLSPNFYFFILDIILELLTSPMYVLHIFRCIYEIPTLSHAYKLVDFDLFISGSPVTRWATVAFGAGIGIGSAYTDCSRIFDGSPAKLAPPKLDEAPAPQVGANVLFNY